MHKRWSTDTLLQAGLDDNNWVLPAKTYAGNRYTALKRVDKTNVASLRLAWSTVVADDGQQEASPIIWNGVMYVATPHDGVLALDAATGKKIWNVQGCRDTSNSSYAMASYIYKGQLIVGTAGGDNGTRGLVSAFSIKDGTRLWDWRSIPGPGEPGHETWPGDSWKHGGGAVWNGLAVDQENDTLFVTPGNPGPDMVMTGRKGGNLYTNSLVALDISGRQPKMMWYYQIVPNDTHDTDPAMNPVLFEGEVNKQKRSLVAVGDKGGNFVILDRRTGEVVHRVAVSKQVDVYTPPTLKGIFACPNHGGGIEWNGGAMIRRATHSSYQAPTNARCTRSRPRTRRTLPVNSIWVVRCRNGRTAPVR